MREGTHTAPSGAVFALRPLRGLDEYRACVSLQHETWGAGFSENVPVVMLMVSQRLGGVSAGAFDRDGRLAGFVFGITGVEDGEVVHWSDMLAVRPEHRNSGLGIALKAYQRHRMLDMGVNRIYWTFDPLQSKNAWINMGRLGAVSTEYVVDMYGVSDSPLHAGIGTDRLVVRWEIATIRVEARLARSDRLPNHADIAAVPSALSPILAPERPVDVPPEGSIPVLPAPGEPELAHTEAGSVTVALPSDIDALKARDPDLARRWRHATRSTLSSYIDAGFEVRELVRGAPVSWYVLERESSTPVPPPPDPPEVSES